MSIGPKIIFPCNHLVVNTDKLYGRVNMERGTIPGYPDKLPANISMLRVDRIESADGAIEYSPGIDYEQKVSKNIIEWINPSNNPLHGEKYGVIGCYTKVSTIQFEPEKCERCCGNGWYAGIFTEKGTDTVSLEEKLIQDFIKVLFTEKGTDGYGSKIKDIISSNTFNEAELGLEVASIMMDCEDQIKKSQREHMNGGNEIDMSEELSQIIVKDVIFVREETTCYITIELINADNKAIGFGFKIL